MSHKINRLKTSDHPLTSQGVCMCILVFVCVCVCVCVAEMLNVGRNIRDKYYNHPLPHLVTVPPSPSSPATTTEQGQSLERVGRCEGGGLGGGASRTAPTPAPFPPRR